MDISIKADDNPVTFAKRYIYFYHRKNINYKLSSNAYFEEKKIN